MLIRVPDFSLVLLMGASGSGKSSFAAAHFLPTEVVSSDRARGWVADDETDQEATGDAFDLVHAVIAKRLARRRLTVVDATNVQADARRGLLALAKQFHARTVAIALDLPEALCLERNRARADRQFGAHVVKRQADALRRSLRGLEREGVREVTRLTSADEVAAATIERVPLWVDKRGEAGPFDIIGDVHGCADELETLLATLGYAVRWNGRDVAVTPPEGRRAVFVGDLVDRGPRSPDVLRIVKAMTDAGHAFAVVGNHDDKLKRHLSNRPVTVSHGLAETIAQFADEPPAFAAEMRRWLDGLVSHYVLDGGTLVVAHAGLKAEMQNRASGAVRQFAMYGETTGETDEYGLPVRHDWAAGYKGAAKVVYGHTPTVEPRWVNGTLCIDTGCCFGGRLTALRWPEGELVSVPAERVYYEPIRPLGAPRPAGGDAGQLDIADVMGRQAIDTRLIGPVVVREDQAAAALEVMSRFAADPRWIIHLPPTMSPPETSARAGWLERPEEAFAYYATKGVGEVVVQEKHMGSRALVVLARDAEAAAARFGVEDGSQGAVLTRTGRRFADRALEAAMLARLAAAADAAGLWDELGSPWALLDAEIMPWNLKAGALVLGQYAPVGAAAREGLGAARDVLAAAAARGVGGDIGVGALADATAARLARAEAYTAAYGRYVAPFAGIDDVVVAPFHVLASEGAVHDGRDHPWHMGLAERLAVADPKLVRATRWRRVDLRNEVQVAEATAWWEALTEAGGEGMVVKPLDFVARGKRGVLQPAIKCRGREYLRIIYGPEYDLPENLARLRVRNLATKRGMAQREFALGLEALHRFVEHQPLTRVHQCAFAVLAMESEGVDPRL